MTDTTISPDGHRELKREGYESEAAAALDFATEYLEPIEVAAEGTHVVLTVAAGQRVVTLDTEPWGDLPVRKRGSIVLHDGDSFGRYITDHSTGVATSLYADVKARKVVGILDGHERGADAPGWGEHRAELALRFTDEWSAWLARNGKIEGQTEFAYHIEERMLDVVEPDGATLLELAQSFQATVNVNFKRAERLDSGETALRFEETVDARAGRQGEIDIPQTFTLDVPVFEGDEPTRITAHLRYRLRDGQLRIGYQLVRPEEAIRESFSRVLDVIEAETGIAPYHGAAPAPGR